VRRRLASLYEPFASRYCCWPSEGVARDLPPLAPRLAPRNLLALAKVRIDENSIDSMVFGVRPASLAIHHVTLCHRRPREIARRADVCEWSFALVCGSDDGGADVMC
jgi:hypothetical protein